MSDTKTADIDELAKVAEGLMDHHVSAALKTVMAEMAKIPDDDFSSLVACATYGHSMALKLVLISQMSGMRAVWQLALTEKEQTDETFTKMVADLREKIHRDIDAVITAAADELRKST